MRGGIIIVLIAASMSVGIALADCQKSKKNIDSKFALPTQEQAVKQKSETLHGGQSAQVLSNEGVLAVKPSLLTEEEQKSFNGDWTEPSSLTQKDALKYLRILLRGDPETILWYKSEDAKPYGDTRFLYQTHICATVRFLAWEQNKEGYNLILQVAEQQSNYPQARACAAEALGWYGELINRKWQGDNRAIPTLKRMVNDKNPELKLQAAGTLLSLGEIDIALPVLDELAKAGIHESTFALNKLFAPEERVEDGEKRLVVSHQKLWDERGKDILKKALDYSSIEVKAFAAARLAEMGINKNSEQASLQILEKLKNRTIKDYGIDPQKGVPTTDPKAISFYSDGRACSHAIYSLKVINSNKAIPVLTYVKQNNKDWWYVCGSNDVSFPVK